jgi:hypothetical protein
MNRETLAAELRSLPDLRASFPMACADPAFVRCLEESIMTPELVRSFDRLYGATLATRASRIEQMVDEATGKREDDMRRFAEFVHDCIYLRLPNEAIHALRLGGPNAR